MSYPQAVMVKFKVIAYRTVQKGTAFKHLESYLFKPCDCFHLSDVEISIFVRRWRHNAKLRIVPTKIPLCEPGIITNMFCLCEQKHPMYTRSYTAKITNSSGTAKYFYAHRWLFYWVLYGILSVTGYSLSQSLWFLFSPSRDCFLACCMTIESTICPGAPHMTIKATQGVASWFLALCISKPVSRGQECMLQMSRL